MDGLALAAEWDRLRKRHTFLADLFRALKASGHMEAAFAAAESGDRVFDAAQAVHRERMTKLTAGSPVEGRA